MASVYEQLMADVAAAFGTTCEPYKKGHSMTVATEGDRTQTIRSLVKTHAASGQEMLMLYTPVGRFDSYVDMYGLLARNLETLVARVAVLDQTVIVMACTVLSDTTLLEARLAVEEVANVGDQLERDIFGVDRY